MKPKSASRTKKISKDELNKRRAVSKDKETFIELNEWLEKCRAINQTHTLTQQQILGYKEFIEISQKISLTKKTIEDTIILGCKQLCGFSIEFKKSPTKIFPNRTSLYTLLHRPKIHPKENSNCQLHSQLVRLDQRKKYLTLITPLIQEIFLSNQQTDNQKNPTWVMKKLQILKKYKQNFVFQGLQGNQKRQLKKAFDNLVLKVKKQIQSKTQSPLKESKPIAKTKKIKKVPKKKLQKQSQNFRTENIKKTRRQKLKHQESQKKFSIQAPIEAPIRQPIEEPIEELIEDANFFPEIKKAEIVEMEMMEEEEVEQKSKNIYEKCFNEVEQLFNGQNAYPKLQANIFQTPPRKKERLVFDLQKSAPKKAPSTYSKSYQQKLHLKRKLLFDNDWQEIKNQKGDSESENKN